MQIQTTDEIEGVPLLKIRALFRQAGLDGVVSADFVRRQLNLTKAKTASPRFDEWVSWSGSELGGV